MTHGFGLKWDRYRIPVWNLYVDPNSISDEINNVVTLDEKGCGGWEKLIRGRLGSTSSLE